MNIQVEVIWITLRTIAHSLMVYARVLEACIHFALMYKKYHTFLVIPMKDQINKDSDQTTSFKLATGKKLLVSHSHVLFCPCIVRKSTAHVGKKV